MLTAEQILENYNKHISIINHYIDSERRDKVVSMIDSLGENYVMSPASGKSWYHNAFAGGYVEHVNRVVEIAIKMSKFWESMHGNVDFTQEELVFAALFHDLGKIGDGNGAGYLQQTDSWRRDKLSEHYTPNPDLDFMLIPDRSLYLLQKYGIQVSQKEYLGIRLHDGVYDEANKAYFFSYNESSRMKTNIVNVLHMADFMASKVEYDIWKANGGSSAPTSQKTKTSTGKTVKSSEGLANILKNI
jgi:hypothetical protein